MLTTIRNALKTLRWQKPNTLQQWHFGNTIDENRKFHSMTTTWHWHTDGQNYTLSIVFLHCVMAGCLSALLYDQLY